MPSSFNYEEFIAKDSKEVFELISHGLLQTKGHQEPLDILYHTAI